MTSPIARVDLETIERYSARLRRYGESPMTLGWGSREQQVYRFDRALDAVPAAGRSVLDVGCGFGDLRSRIRERGISITRYIGVDVNPDLLAIAAHRHADGRFVRANPADLSHDDISADVGVMLGLLNFRQTHVSNLEYCRTIIERAFALCDEALVFDALSAHRDERYPEEAQVFYYDPAQVLSMALNLTPYVTLHHDYRSIPQREMLVVLRRVPCV